MSFSKADPHTVAALESNRRGMRGRVSGDKNKDAGADHDDDEDHGHNTSWVMVSVVNKKETGASAALLALGPLQKKAER